MAHQWNGGPVEVRFSARHIFYVTYNVGHAVVRQDDGTMDSTRSLPAGQRDVGDTPPPLPGGYIGPISDEHYFRTSPSGFGDYIDEV